MAYIDRPVTSTAVGKVRLSTLLPGIAPVFFSLAFIFPGTNAGKVGVGDSSMAALPDNAYSGNDSTTYPPAVLGRPWDVTQIYLWFENEGDVVYVRGNNG